MNECGDCTLCCTLFPVPELDKEMNTACIHSNKGCNIHDTKPAGCSAFDCAFRQTNVLKELRPDICGVVFEKLSGRLFFGTLDPNNNVSEVAKRQISSFTNQGYSVILASSKHMANQTFLAEGHSEIEIQAELIAHLEKNGYLRN